MDVLLSTPIDPLSYQIIPDLGLMYLAASLRESGIDVRIVDPRKERWEASRFEQYVRENRPSIVGIKCYSHEVRRVARMAEAARRSQPDAVIVVGGPHPSMDPVGTLEEMPAVDYAFVGEAERSLVELFLWIQSGRSAPLPEGLRGIAARGNEGVEVRPPVYEENLDRLALPAWDLMRPDRYPDEAAGVFVPASRGADDAESWLSVQVYVLRMPGHRGPEDAVSVRGERDPRDRPSGARLRCANVHICGRQLHLQPRTRPRPFRALASRRRPIHFTFPNGVRADSLDAELLKAMETAGCYLVALGIESASDATLRRMRKKQTRAEVEDAVRLIRRTGRMKVTGFFILGYPGESLSDVRETIRFAARLPIHHAHFCLFIPIPGTEAYDEVCGEGWLANREERDPERLTIDRPSLSLPGLPSGKLLRLHQYAYFRFYAAPWRIVDLLLQLRSLGHIRLILRRFRKLFA